MDRQDWRAGLVGGLCLALLGAASAQGATLWEATAELGNFSEWNGPQVKEPNRATTPTADPAPLTGLRSFGLEVRPGDYGPNLCDIASNCERAQANGPELHQEGEEDYTAVAIYVPSTYPTSSYTGNDHFQVAWQWHGFPYGGSPPLEIGINEQATALDVHHSWWRNGVRSGPQVFKKLKSIALEKGKWLKFIWRVKWSRYDNQAFAELWYAPHGQPLVRQTFNDGTQRETGSTLVSDMTRGVAPRADNYRRRGSPNAATTVYFDAIRASTTFDEAVAAFPDSPLQYSKIENVGSRSATTTGTSLSVTKPAGTASGHAMVAAIENDGRSAVTAPSGWSQVCQADTGNGPSRLHVFRKTAGASEPASYTWTFGGVGKHAGGLTVRSGVDPTDPIMASSCFDRGDGNDMVAPSLTPTIPNALLVAGGVSSKGITIGTPAPMAERFDARTGTSGSDRAVSMATEKLTGTAPSGTRTFVNEVPSLGPTDIAAYSVLLRPATL